MMSAEQTVNRLRLRKETGEVQEIAAALFHRPRRLRRLDNLRRLVRETHAGHGGQRNDMRRGGISSLEYGHG